jgi:hypothetical protein
VKEINYLERKVLGLLDFKLAVSPSLYAQYYYELGSICDEKTSTSQLSKLQLRKIEKRSHLSEQYQQNKYSYKKRTMTMDQIKSSSARLVLL